MAGPGAVAGCAGSGGGGNRGRDGGPTSDGTHPQLTSPPAPRPAPQPAAPQPQTVGSAGAARPSGAVSGRELRYSVAELSCGALGRFCGVRRVVVAGVTVQSGWPGILGVFVP